MNEFKSIEFTANTNIHTQSQQLINNTHIHTQKLKSARRRRHLKINLNLAMTSLM